MIFSFFFYKKKKKYKKKIKKFNIYRRLVSIQGAFGYEPNEIPLLHDDLIKY